MVIEIGGVVGAILGAIPFAVIVYGLCWWFGDER